MHVCKYQRILQLLIITSFLTQKHLNYHLKGTLIPVTGQTAESRELTHGNQKFSMHKYYARIYSFWDNKLDNNLKKKTKNVHFYIFKNTQLQYKEL